MPTVSILVTVSTEDDNIANNLWRSLQVYKKDEDIDLCVVTPDTNVEVITNNLNDFGFNKATVISDESILDESCDLEEGEWHRKQCLKLFASAKLESDFVLTLDADCFAMEPFNSNTLFSDDGKPRISGNASPDAMHKVWSVTAAHLVSAVTGIDCSTLIRKTNNEAVWGLTPSLLKTEVCRDMVEEFTPIGVLNALQKGTNEYALYSLFAIAKEKWPSYATDKPGLTCDITVINKVKKFLLLKDGLVRSPGVTFGVIQSFLNINQTVVSGILRETVLQTPWPAGSPRITLIFYIESIEDFEEDLLNRNASQLYPLVDTIVMTQDPNVVKEIESFRKQGIRAIEVKNEGWNEWVSVALENCYSEYISFSNPHIYPTHCWANTMVMALQKEGVVAANCDSVIAIDPRNSRFAVSDSNNTGIVDTCVFDVKWVKEQGTNDPAGLFDLVQAKKKINVLENSCLLNIHIVAQHETWNRTHDISQAFPLDSSRDLARVLADFTTQGFVDYVDFSVPDDSVFRAEPSGWLFRADGSVSAAGWVAVVILSILLIVGIVLLIYATVQTVRESKNKGAAFVRKKSN